MQQDQNSLQNAFWLEQLCARRAGLFQSKRSAVQCARSAASKRIGGVWWCISAVLCDWVDLVGLVARRGSWNGARRTVLAPPWRAAIQQRIDGTTLHCAMMELMLATVAMQSTQAACLCLARPDIQLD